MSSCEQFCALWEFVLKVLWHALVISR